MLHSLDASDLEGNPLIVGLKDSPLSSSKSFPAKTSSDKSNDSVVLKDLLIGKGGITSVREAPERPDRTPIED
jgi:hypothetical protein